MASCRECALFNLNACRDKAGRVRRDWLGECRWRHRGVIPDSITSLARVVRRGEQLMLPDEGQRCPCFIKRTDAP